MSKDDLGDRMKMYESIETQRKFIPLLPIYARLDGRGFSKFTKGMNRPFDENFYQCMLKTVIHLVEKTNPLICYFQSDEISLCWDYNNIPFDGKIHKIISTLAAEASSAFVISATEYFPDRVKKLTPHFDCRLVQMPNKSEVANAFVWRNNDCTKNAISQVASHYFSHKQLQNKTGKEKQEMLFSEYGINFNDIPVKFKRGTWVRKKPVEKETINPYTNEQIVSIRNEIEVLTDIVPRFSKCVNKVGFIFNKEQAIVDIL
ncbi:tRNA(His) guanylyltransferase Thg1 family protein [Flavobacterium sp.]|uniref:tRNA(His) guanylyltransferase Thg1 family protein n=1 Tax=Flavobacterium sp. TaxID=239 RepID=UPI00260DEFF6|nr:tRNA(His) guanylyltransferase Thg1 family protein [Flavobacterium sp.]